MVWALVYNIILTKSSESLFQAQHQWSSKECQRKSIMPADGSTDKSTTEQGAVDVLYTGTNGRPTTVHILLTLLP